MICVGVGVGVVFTPTVLFGGWSVFRFLCATLISLSLCVRACTVLCSPFLSHVCITTAVFLLFYRCYGTMDSGLVYLTSEDQRHTPT